MLMESCCCAAVVMELDVFWECNLSSVDFSMDKKASSLVSPLLGAMMMDDNSNDDNRFDFVVL